MPNSVTACLIVRDEEAAIARCLESIKDVVDEIVVVDTGSTDATVAIVESFGAKVFHFEWVDDFAAARNESLRHASSEWILQIDADEELVQDEPGALRLAIRNSSRKPASRSGLSTQHSVLLITVRSPSDEQSSAETVGQQCRIFRNHGGLHFQGRIHEQLRTRDGRTPANIAAAPASVYLHHSGYIDTGDVLKQKGDRNRRLLELSISEEPQQPAHQFNLGRQLAWEGRFEEALKPLERAIELWGAHGAPADGYVPSMFSTAALAANKQARWDKVLALYECAPEHAVSSELVYVAGIAAWRTGDLARAEQLLNRAWQDKSLARGTGFDPSTAGWRPLTALAELYESQGEHEKAHAALSRVQNSEFRTPNSAPAPNSQFTIPNSISACLIARDEESNLPRCLESLRGFVDEVIVVDTGSKDRTAELAKQFGAKVFHFDWCDDFAAARNQSLRCASAEWILWIDADDELVQRQPGALRALAAQAAGANAFWLEVQSLSSENGELGAVTRQSRLIRNGLGIHFRGRIHEQLVLDELPQSQLLIPVAQDSVLIRHWGYIPSGDVLDRKCERNRQLLELEIADRPGDPYPRYMLGKQYGWQRDYTAALEALQQAIECWRYAGRPPATYVGPLFAVAACSGLNLGQFDRTLEFEASCPAEAVSSDLLYYAAIACQRLGRLEDALQRLERAIGDASVRNQAETDPATAGWRAWYLTSQVCHALGRQAEAYGAASKAVESMPARPDILLGFATMALNGGHEDDARRVAERVLASAPDDEYAERARQLLAKIQNAQPVAV